MQAAFYLRWLPGPLVTLALSSISASNSAAVGFQARAATYGLFHRLLCSSAAARPPLNNSFSCGWIHKQARSTLRDIAAILRATLLSLQGPSSTLPPKSREFPPTIRSAPPLQGLTGSRPTPDSWLTTGTPTLSITSVMGTLRYVQILPVPSVSPSEDKVDS